MRRHVPIPEQPQHRTHSRIGHSTCSMNSPRLRHAKIWVSKQGNCEVTTNLLIGFQTESRASCAQSAYKYLKTHNRISNTRIFRTEGKRDEHDTDRRPAAPGRNAALAD